MKKKVLIIIAAFALVTLSAVSVWAYKTGKLSGLADQIEQAQLSPGVHIKVKLKSGSPASGYYVRFAKKPEIGAIAPNRSDSSGYVHLGVQTYADDYQIRVTYNENGSSHACDYYDPEKYYSVQKQEVQFEITVPCGGDGAPPEEPVKTASLSGYVFSTSDPAKAKVTGAAVHLYESFPTNRVASTTTDSNGWYEFKSVSLDKPNHSIKVTKEGFEAFDEGVVLKEGGNEKNIGLIVSNEEPKVENFTLSGMIQDSKTTALIADAEVKVSWRTSDGKLYSLSTKSNDGKGADGPINNYLIDNILVYNSWSDTQAYFVEIKSKGCDNYASWFEVKLEDLVYISNKDEIGYFYYADFDLSCRTRVEISGSIEDSIEMTEISDAKLTLFIENDAGDAIETFKDTTNEMGNYHIYDVPYYPEYNYHFMVRHPAYENLTRSLKLPKPTPDNTIEQNFVVDPLMRLISGFVVDKKTKFPINNALIKINTPNGKVIETYTDESGYYQWANAYVGNNELTALHPDYAPKDNVKKVSVARNEKNYSVNFALEEGTNPVAMIQGQVISEKIGERLCVVTTFKMPSQEVKLFSLDASGKETFLVAQMSDLSGSFSFGSLSTGKYILKVDSEYFHGEKQVELEGFSKNVTLNLKTKTQLPLTVIKYHGISFEFYGPLAQKYIDKYQWKDHAFQMKKMLDELYYNVPNQKVVIVDGFAGRVGAFAASECDTIVIGTSYLEAIPEDESYLTDMLIHELAHTIRKYMGKNQNLFLMMLGYNYQAAKSIGTCPFVAVADSTIMGNSGHAADNDHEYFAYFAEAYYLHRNTLLNRIQESDTQCQNVLAYTWELFSYEVGAVKAGDQDLFPPRGNKMKLYYKEDIVRGNWRAVTDKKTSMQKATDLVADSISSVSVSTMPYLRKLTISANKTIGAMEKLAFWKQKGSAQIFIMQKIDGRLVPKVGSIVNIGNRSCTVDANGMCHFEGLFVGSNGINIYDGKSYLSLTPFTLEDEMITSIKVEADNITEIMLIAK